MQEITNGALLAIGNYIVIGIALVMGFFIRWVVKRIKCLVLCQIEIMNGLMDLGVNGDIKKRYDALIEQLSND